MEFVSIVGQNYLGSFLANNQHTSHRKLSVFVNKESDSQFLLLFMEPLIVINSQI